MRRQQHSFSKHDRMCLWKCQSFWDRKCLDLWGTRPPNLRIHAECPNHLSYQGQTFAVPYFEHWLWRYKLLVVAQSNQIIDQWTVVFRSNICFYYIWVFSYDIIGSFMRTFLTRVAYMIHQWSSECCIAIVVNGLSSTAVPETTIIQISIKIQ